MMRLMLLLKAYGKQRYVNFQPAPQFLSREIFKYCSFLALFKMRWAWLLILSFILLAGCASKVSDTELEAQLQNLSVEELQKVIAESEQEQAKALAGQAYQRGVQVGGKSFSQKEVSQAAYKVAYQKLSLPSPFTCKIVKPSECEGNKVVFLGQAFPGNPPPYPLPFLYHASQSPQTNKVLCCSGQGIGKECGQNFENAWFWREKQGETKVATSLEINPSYISEQDLVNYVPICLSGVTCQWSQTQTSGYNFVIGYSGGLKDQPDPTTPWGWLRDQEFLGGKFKKSVNLYCKPAAPPPSIPVVPLVLCGNNKCEAGEDKSCPQDCKFLPLDIKPLQLPAKSCGNKICEINLQETPKSCPQDCDFKPAVMVGESQQQGPESAYNITSCTDTDGKNYQVKGSVSSTLMNFFGSKASLEVEDTCMSDKKIIEYFCYAQQGNFFGIGEEVFDCTSLGKQYRCIESYLPPYGFLGKCSASWCAPPQGLVSWWPGENTGNDVQNNNHGILQNDVDFVDGMVGKSFAFDNLDKYGNVHSGDGYVEYVKIPDGPSLTPAALTIEGWVYASSFPANPIEHSVIVSKSDSAQQKSYYLTASPDGVVHFTVAGNNAIRTQAPVLSTNKWRHVAATYEQGKTYKIYIDGSEAPIVTAPALAPVADSTVPLTIGASVDAQNIPKEFWHGMIDEVSIYNRALSASEIWGIVMAQEVGKCT